MCFAVKHIEVSFLPEHYKHMTDVLNTYFSRRDSEYATVWTPRRFFLEFHAVYTFLPIILYSLLLTLYLALRTISLQTMHSALAE